MAQGDLKLKLWINSKSQRVLFGEADKKLIDFLFNLLSLPLGTVIKPLQNQNIFGSLENLYESLQNLPNQISKDHNAILLEKYSKVPEPMTEEKDATSRYTVMDDMSVKYMSTLTLLNKFNIKKLGDLEEKIVTLDINKVVKLMKASLHSKTVLTDVFLKKKLLKITIFNALRSLFMFVKLGLIMFGFLFCVFLVCLFCYMPDRNMPRYMYL